MTTTALLIPLLPFFAGVVISLLGKRFASSVTTIGISATVGAGILSLVTLYFVSSGEPFRVSLWPLQDDDASFFTFGMLVDRLTAVMMVLITGVSTVIHVYSVRYLQGDPGYARFFALLSFMTFVILALVSSPNLLMLFVFWQLLSWVLYLLLVFNFSHVPAYQNAFKTFIVHRVEERRPSHKAENKIMARTRAERERMTNDALQNAWPTCPPDCFIIWRKNGCPGISAWEKAG